ncbi:capsule biosynthesis protein [Enterovirga rhinocerotis]|uniref:Capsular polysaccharide export protein n=1 Tax=Enterovirga rhinocerotis TaxID=1339210 RepID=A0A4R7BS14_9HYPH|nr:capsular biosynthesis protein [Enterovirga rhinocerotis]TDR87255.1 capsular polysaccharide export protein [Enterovirga rhinocerotis]
MRSGHAGRQVFLFLQGPITPFFAEVADALEARGHKALRINLCYGDSLFWRRGGATDYRGPLEAWPAFVSEFLDSRGVTDLVLLGEQRFYHKVAVAAAKARNIRVTVTDFGYLRPDWITLEPDGMSGDSAFPREPDAIRALAAAAPEPDLTVKYGDSFFTQAVWDMAYHLSSSLLSFRYPGYRSHQVHHPAFVYLGTGLHFLRAKRGHKRANRLIQSVRESGVPYWVFPLQMENDFQLRAYSPYPDLKTPIHEVIRSFAANAPADARLLVKIHPLDPGMRNWGRLVRRSAANWGVRNRVDFLDGGQLDTLLDGARGVVTVNSTVGLWGLRSGKPLITLGAAVFDIEGLAFKGHLDRFWAEAQPPDQELLTAFIRAIASEIQIRGVYYGREGLSAAVRAAADRLDLAAQTNPSVLRQEVSQAGPEDAQALEPDRASVA